MFDRQRMFLPISVLLMVQNGFLAAVALHLSPDLDTAMMAGLAAGVVALSITTAMMATRIAGSEQVPAGGSGAKATHTKLGAKSEYGPHRPYLVSVQNKAHLIALPFSKAKPAPADADRAPSAELALSMLDAGLRRLAVGDLSVRLETPFPEKYEGLRGDFNRAVETLDDGLMAITASAALLHTDCAEARLELQQEKIKKARHQPSLASALKHLSDVEADVRAQMVVCDDVSRTAEQAKLRFADVRDRADAATRSGEGLSGVDDRLRGVAGLMRDIAFKTNMLSVNANIEAAKTGPLLSSFSSELRKLAEEGADVAKQASVLERDIALAITATTSSIDRMSKEARELESSMESAQAKLSTAACRIENTDDLIRKARLGIDVATQSENERGALDKAREIVLERMAAAVAVINRNCASFIPVTVLHEGGTPPDNPPSRPRSHLRLVKN